jgi:hypothetical protein
VRGFTCALVASVAPLLLAADAGSRVPRAFRFEAEVQTQLHQLWENSSRDKAERVACLGATIQGDTVKISRLLPLDVGRSDSLGISAASSLESCGPPAWHGTVHTHVALVDGRQPYSLFSGADRGVMMLWWRRWAVDGVFCLLYTEKDVICEIEGPGGAVLFPRSHY